MLYSKSECPVENFDKAWIDTALLWFEQKSGKDFIRNKKYLVPADCRFDYQYFDSHEAIQYFIEFICAYIEFDASLITFQLFWDEETKLLEDIDTATENSLLIHDYNFNAEGRYEIIIEENNLNDFDGTFISLIYKLTYVKLLHQKVFTFENIYMVNYAMVLHGFGVLMANSFVRTAQWRGLNYSAWSVKRMGLLNHRMYGYLFAVLYNYRMGKEEAWQKYLCADVQHFYTQSCKFLAEEMDGEKLPGTPGVHVKDDEVFFEKFFYEDGGLYLIAHILEERYEGVATFYHKNGVVWSERIYKNGMPFTVLSNFNSYDEEVEKGTLFEGNGTLYLYKPDGNLKEIETYKAGIRIGIVTA